MLFAPTIPKEPNNELALNHELLYAAGLAHVQRLASRTWTDYNVHDPGVTTLELLSYALTDLSYRANFSVPDLLTTATGAAPEFFTARRILPNRPLTLLDYRKLLIDLKGVKNAWLKPVTLTYYADTINGTLSATMSNKPGIKPVSVRGLYDVLVDFNDGLTSAAKKSEVMNTVKATLQKNRNLCEDFVSFRQVRTQDFLLCAELELWPEADVSEVQARIYFEVQQYLAPNVRNYTLEEMLARKKKDGTPFPVDEIFEGPFLDCGFIDDEELAQADLRTTIYLSDVIAVIMDIDGVRAVRDIVVNPEFTKTSLENKWVVPVPPGRKALLEREDSRLVFYKRNMPVTANKAKAAARYDELVSESTALMENAVQYDLKVPGGSYRTPAAYYSFQNHFPALYGLSEDGLSGAVNEKRKALVLQLKGYLLFFDQIMANYLAQLSNVKELFSTDPNLKQSYFTQLVKSLADHEKVYPASNALNKLKGIIETADTFVERRNRFLDHLIARFAEQFTDTAHIASSALGTTAKQMIGIKCKFLEDYPERSSERALAYDYTQAAPAKLWDTDNVSGLEKRLAKLLGLSPATRRDLSAGTDGMYVIEMILLRPELNPDPFALICPDPNCIDCAEEDPYSYRIHVILPAEQKRFAKMEFRRFVEEVIRQETPAHILPRICWISNEEMAKLEVAYKDWIFLKAGADTKKRTAKLKAFIDILFEVRNVYPAQKLHECGAPEGEQKFLLGQTALGTMKK
ncbi:MAG: uncharacterized protein QOD12_854 [Verrucomicrobiota bacterium]